MAVTEDQLRQIATSFLSAFDTLSATDHIALRADTCTHLFAPASIGIPPKSNADFANHILNNIVPLASSFRVDAKETHVHTTAAGGQVTIWATGTPMFREEVMDGEEGEWKYTGEYIFILDVDEEGKIVRVLEFLDSAGTAHLRGLMVRARRNLGTSDRKAW
ncbi:hypothetical protein N0V91_007184 [Didymella pomorum]|jgi:hypothetical protein|uniref:SnoaL-like domain-containing protein n=1 Tax=Didymella pomorum TaxID=749634 RepID=A0A9W9D5K3_9PLEO|nr:hypothetical protein N0V91_007184 [Didymella pomorum]